MTSDVRLHAKGDRSDHIVPLLAYSTGLLAGWVFVDIIAHLIGAHPGEGNRMSTAKADVLELLEDVPENDQSSEMGRILARISLAKDYPYPARELSAAESELWEALQEITAPTAKAEILAALNQLPDDCAMEDVIEELDEREHLRRGLASAIYEPRLGQEEVEAWIEQCARE